MSDWNSVFGATPQVATSRADPGYCEHGTTLTKSCRHCRRDARRELRVVVPTARAVASVPDPIRNRIALHVLEILSVPQTDEQLVDRYQAAGYPPRSPQRLRTIRAELTNDGRVVDSGMKRRTRLGNSAIAWIRASATMASGGVPDALDANR